MRRTKRFEIPTRTSWKRTRAACRRRWRSETERWSDSELSAKAEKENLEKSIEVMAGNNVTLTKRLEAAQKDRAEY